MTADVSTYGRRERDLHNRHFPRLSAERPNLGVGALVVPDMVNRDDYNAALTWDDIAWLRSRTSLPIMVKGVMTGEDAILAVEAGADVVYVSNHGGRQLDHLPATIEVLPEVCDAVRGRAEVLLASGIVRGTDVVRALAFGASPSRSGS